MMMDGVGRCPSGPGLSPTAEPLRVSSADAASIPNAADARSQSVKTLENVKADMSELYEALRAGHVDVKLASELANITGKYLKAEQLKLAREIFSANQSMRQISND